MAKEELIKLEGVVVDSMAGAKFKVLIDKPEGSDKPDYFVTAYPTGNMRRNFIKILDGDRVTVEVSPYDLKSGRIILREK